MNTPLSATLTLMLFAASGSAAAQQVGEGAETAADAPSYLAPHGEPAVLNSAAVGSSQASNDHRATDLFQSCALSRVCAASTDGAASGARILCACRAAREASLAQTVPAPSGRPGL